MSLGFWGFGGDTQPILTAVPPQRGRNVHIIEDVTTPLETQRVPPRRSPRLRMPQFHAANAAIFLNKKALHEVVANAMAVPQAWVTQSFKKVDNMTHVNDIDHFCAGVTHPTTGATITNYRKLISIPTMKEVWTNAMCKELGNISDGWNETKGTQTVKFMNHEQIKRIPNGRTIMYARIVVDYRPQKEDPMRSKWTGQEVYIVALHWIGITQKGG